MLRNLTLKEKQERAQELRVKAEATTCPEYYEEAAQAFIDLDMVFAAQRMLDRAGHYREEQQKEGWKPCPYCGRWFKAAGNNRCCGQWHCKKQLDSDRYRRYNAKRGKRLTKAETSL